MDVAPPLTMAVLLLLLGVDHGVTRDGLLPKGEGDEEPFLRSDHDSLPDTTEASQNLQAIPPMEVPPDFFCHSCQEVSRKAERFLSDPSLYDHANNLSSQVCHVMHSKHLQIKCRRLVELYLHEAIMFLQIAFSEKNLCNSTGFCPPITLAEHHRGFPPSIERPRLVLPLWKLQQLLSKVVTCSSTQQYYAPAMEAKIKSKTCNTCHTVADIVAKELEDHDQQIAIMQSLLDACEAFRIYVARCKVWVFEYGPLFLANIHRFIMVHDVCRIIHFCAEPMPPRKEAEPSWNLRSTWDLGVCSEAT